MIRLDPELTAAEVLARAEVIEPPVDPIALSGLWPGLRVTLADIDGAGYLVSLKGIIGELLLRREDPLPRRRYTCAHEIGHWLLAKWPEAVPESTKHASVERWCDRFAAALLMPATWIVNELMRNSLDIDAIATLPSRFGVSRQAALLRVSELAPVELGIANVSHDDVTFAWTTARGRLGRFSWVDSGWLAAELQSRREVRLSVDGMELQARCLHASSWMVAAASTAALRGWHSRPISGTAMPDRIERCPSLS